MGHPVGTAERGLATAQGRLNGPIPHVIIDVPDAELAGRYRELDGRLRTAWSQVDLHETVQAPWGTTSAADAASGFATETLVHDWDLVVATGQTNEAQPEVVRPVLDQAAGPCRLSGARGRRATLSLAGASAESTERLANWLGHHR